MYIKTKVYCSYNQNWKSVTVFHPNIILEKKGRRTELTVVCAHILASITFPRVMLPLSLFWQWEFLLQALSIWSSSLVGTPQSCWWFQLTWPPSFMFAIMLSHLILLCSAAPCYVQTHCLWYLFSMLDTFPLSYFWHPGVHFFGWTWFFGLGVSNACLFPISPFSCVWCLHFSSCCLTNLWFYMWHHCVRVIRTKENRLAVDNPQLWNALLQLNHIKVKLLEGQ